MTEPRVCNQKFTCAATGPMRVYQCALPRGHEGECDDSPTRGLLRVEAGDRALETAREIYDAQCDNGRTFDNALSLEEIAALIQSAMNAQEREIAKLIDLYTGPTGGWLVAPIFLKEEIERVLAERGEGYEPRRTFDGVTNCW